jgi:hypothetical protein
MEPIKVFFFLSKTIIFLILINKSVRLEVFFFFEQNRKYES